jgi:hypothetical protein
MALSAVSTFGSLSDLDGFCQIVSIVKAQASGHRQQAQRCKTASPWLAIFVFLWQFRSGVLLVTEPTPLPV